MKIIKFPDYKPRTPWNGHRVFCESCGGKFELEAQDVPTKLHYAYHTECPFCGAMTRMQYVDEDVFDDAFEHTRALARIKAKSLIS